MRIGELLVAAGLVTTADVSAAIGRQRREGGRLGQNLIAMGAIEEAALATFIDGIPAEPLSAKETGIDEKSLVDLILKTMATTPAETLFDLSTALKLPPKVVTDLVDMAVRGQILALAGSGSGGDAGGMMRARYEMTQQGKRRAQEALERSRYIGPAPITLAAYGEMLIRQKITNEAIDAASMHAAFSDLEVPRAFVDQIGPAICAGRALLMYGPPGNGKTSVAQRLERVFKQIIYIPHAVWVEGQIMQVFDPDVHRRVFPDESPLFDISLQRDEADARYVACRRPFIVTGGELTLEMLDLKHEPLANFYVAPLHIKASGGCLLIDDFGRQIVSPTALLNRWIVPLENRVDYLKLHTGKSFRLPFEAIVILSTNLAPSDLMDPAFLRRIPYKLEVGAPAPDTWRRIFTSVAQSFGMGERLSDSIIGQVQHSLTEVHGLELAAFQSRFIIEQIVAGCRFRGIAPDFLPDLIDYAIANLAIGRTGGSITPTLAKVA